MKSPIHVKCARSGELCEECRRKIERGEASDLDVKLTEILSLIEERHKLNEVILVKGIRVENIVLILIRSKTSDLIGKNGKILREIKRMLDSKVRIINAKNQESIIEDTLYPVKPKYVSRVFKPDGTILKIVVPKSSISKLFTKKETVEEALSDMLSIPVKIVEE